MREIVEQLAERINKHFDNEDQLIKDQKEAGLTIEESEYLLRTMLNHPHVIAAKGYKEAIQKVIKEML